MQTIDNGALRRQKEARDYAAASQCEHFRLDKGATSALWHRSFCGHPERPNPVEAGGYQHCDLVWRGSCPFGFMPSLEPDASEQG